MTTNAPAGLASPRFEEIPALVETVRRWAIRVTMTGAALLCVGASASAMSGMWAVLSVPTGSMDPAIRPGSAIIAVSQDVGDVRIGDIIVFEAPSTHDLTVHRVVEIGQIRDTPVFETQGDANEARDPWRLTVDGDRVDHVVAVIPGVGSLASAVSAPRSRIALGSVGAAMVLIAGIRLIWGAPLATGRSPSGEPEVEAPA